MKNIIHIRDWSAFTESTTHILHPVLAYLSWSEHGHSVLLVLFLLVLRALLLRLSVSKPRGQRRRGRARRGVGAPHQDGVGGAGHEDKSARGRVERSAGLERREKRTTAPQVPQKKKKQKQRIRKQNKKRNEKKKGTHIERMCHL